VDEKSESSPIAYVAVDEKSESSPIAYVAVVSKHRLWFAALFTPAGILLGDLCVECGFCVLWAQSGEGTSLRTTAIESLFAEERLARRETIRLRGGGRGQARTNTAGGSPGLVKMQLK